MLIFRSRNLVTVKKIMCVNDHQGTWQLCSSTKFEKLFASLFGSPFSKQRIWPSWFLVMRRNIDIVCFYVVFSYFILPKTRKNNIQHSTKATWSFENSNYLHTSNNKWIHNNWTYYPRAIANLPLRPRAIKRDEDFLF